ncbi:DNA methyltransferase [Hymenobacter sp. CRA2]|nr:DNA methyltransferase [Hymenobacter sp. CRA2]
MYGLASDAAVIQPFLKWAGGKRQLLPEIKARLPKNIYDVTYHEPFVGAGAVLLDILPKNACINDVNKELVNCYNVIKNQSEALIHDLKKHENTEEYFYYIRELDRSEAFSSMSDVEKASRMIYLNKTCFNGLYRVNSKGHFNVPFGNYKNPKYADSALIKALSLYLRNANVNIMNHDFEYALSLAKEGDFVYLDPPYDPLNATSSFVSYTAGQFGRDAQERLKMCIDNLVNKGCNILMSNADTTYIDSMYAGTYIVERVSANRNINANGAGRGKINEVLIRNKYEAYKAKP